MKIDTKEDTYRVHIIDSLIKCSIVSQVWTQKRYAQYTSLGYGAYDRMSDTRTANHATEKSHLCSLACLQSQSYHHKTDLTGTIINLFYYFSHFKLSECPTCRQSQPSTSAATSQETRLSKFIFFCFFVWSLKMIKQHKLLILIKMKLHYPDGLFHHNHLRSIISVRYMSIWFGKLKKSVTIL